MALPMLREPESLEQALPAMTAEATAAFNRGDAKACAGFYTDDATVLVPDWPPVTGRTAIQALLAVYTAAGAKLTKIEPLETSSQGGLGYCLGTYQLDTPAKDGSTIAGTGKFVTVFKQQTNGTWKTVVDSMVADWALAPH